MGNPYREVKMKINSEYVRGFQRFDAGNLDLEGENENGVKFF